MKALILFGLLAAALPALGQITTGEYYLNADPEPGNGTPFTFELVAGIDFGDTQKAVVNIPAGVIATLDGGLNRLAVRVRDSEGDWSIAQTLPFYILPLVSARFQTVVAGEYFIDADPGVGNGSSFPITTGETLVEAFTIPAASIAALDVGLHVLAVRVQDSGGNWSIAKSLPFYRLATLAAGATPEIVKLSYQWFQNGSPISGVYEIFPAANAELVNFDELASLQGLQEGQSYQLTVIAYDNLGQASIPQTASILVETTDSNGDGIPDQWAAQYGYGIHDDIAALDTDSDGLTVQQEFQTGINPLLRDTDGDGLNDKAELDLAALGFDPRVADSTSVTALRENANNAGLYRPEQMQTLALGAPLLARDPASGSFTLTLGLERSTDLNQFDPLPLTPGHSFINADGELEFEFTPPAASTAEFYRIQAK